MHPPARVDELDALLPQTQCRRCGYAGCRAYAQAMWEGRAEINRCPPGGEAVVAQLARRLGRPIRPLDASCGRSGAFALARIEESECIGCAACLRVCPVDAIIGTGKWMHTVLESECTGCELCVAACPVDCIVLQPMPPPEGVGEGSDAGGESFLQAWMRERAPRARARFERRARRRQARSAREAPGLAATGNLDRAEVIAAAVARVRARRRLRAARG